LQNSVCFIGLFCKRDLKKEPTDRSHPISADDCSAANTLQQIHCNTLQHAATHCNTLQRTATYRRAGYRWAAIGRGRSCSATNTLQQILEHAATHCITLYHTATHCSTQTSQRLQGCYRQDAVAAQRNSLQHIHCNTLQHNAKHCDTL